MARRSGWVTFLLFLFLAAVILLQILSMIQSDRLYQRLNDVINVVRGSGMRTASQPTGSASEDQYPGDEGDWLVWRLEGEPYTLMGMHSSSSMYTRYITSDSIFETLLKYDLDEFELVPHLAESFEVSDDGLEIYFKLRDDICFSDGHPITTEDVIFSYETIVNPKIDAQNLANYFRDVDRVEKINDRELKFYMKQVYFKSLEFVGGSIDVLPKHIYEYDDPQEFNKRVSDPVGSGPYVFDRWDTGREVVLTRNENYWDKKPNIKKIVYRFITNDTAAIQALRTHEVDFLRPLPNQYTDLCSDSTFTDEFQCLSYWAPGSGYFWIGWNQDRPFFAERDVRLAMTHLVDRWEIKDHLLENPDVEIPTGNFYIFGPQYDRSIEPWPYDPSVAVELLDRAGWIDHDGDGIRDKNGVLFRFRYMIVSNTFLHEQMAKLVKDECAKVGIDVIIDAYEGSVFFERVKKRQFDAVNMAWGGGLAGDPYQIWHSSQIGGGGSNYVGFNHPEADALMEEARRTLDEVKRNTMYKRFHRILHEEQPYTFIYSRPQQRFLDQRFQNVNIHTLGLDPFEWYVPYELQKYK